MHHGVIHSSNSVCTIVIDQEVKHYYNIIMQGLFYHIKREVRGLAAVRRCYAEGGSNCYAKL